MPMEPRSPIYPHVQVELTRYSLSFTIIRTVFMLHMCHECSLFGRVCVVASLSTLSKVGRLLPFNRVHHKTSNNASEQNGYILFGLAAVRIAMQWCGNNRLK